MLTDVRPLRTAIIGLLGFAAVEEQLLLTSVRRAPAEPGGPDCWAAAPLVAHNTGFKRQQVQRLDAIRRGQAPPDFAEIDHTSGDVYRDCSQQSADGAARDSWDVTAALVDGLGELSDEDLTDPARHPWLKGRPLGLQLIVRGFWHPTGHIGEYYAGHAQPARAVALQAQAVAMTGYLNAPEAARGMAYFNLACAEARAARPDDAFGSLRQAIELNPDLRANASRDADLASLRDSGRLDLLLSR
jgi:hypothetical protein